MSTVYVAHHHNYDDSTMRVCASREIAAKWLASRVDSVEWRTFYDSLKEREGLAREADDNTPEALLAGWYGSGSKPDSWGDGMDCWAEITTETILYADA